MGALNASPFSFIKVAAPVNVAMSGNRGFKFRALKGHFDGEGSTIDFYFYHTCTANRPQLRLAVNATVVKDRGAVVNAANREAARVQWQKFVSHTHGNSVTNSGIKKSC